MLIHPLSRTDEHIEDEHAPHVQSFYFLLMDAFLWTKRDILDTPSVAPSSIGVVHGKGQLKFIYLFFLPILAFIWSLVFWTSLCNLSTFASSIVLGRGLRQS